MKKFMTVIALSGTLFSGMTFAADPVIHWGTTSGGTESTHIAGQGEDLNARHQQVTKTQEGVWGAESGSISADEKALTSDKPPVVSDPKLMPFED